MSFRRAPNWNKSGDPVDGVWKQELLVYLGQRFGLEVLVETGTCEGSTIAAVHPYFKKIHSIELSRPYYERAVQRVGHLSNVELIHGDSVKELDALIYRMPDVPTLFWLDAHPCGGASANNGDPLPGELRIITDRRQGALIVIDDMPDAALPQVEEAGVNLTDWIRDYRTGEIIMSKYNSGYFIPPFV